MDQSGRTQLRQPANFTDRVSRYGVPDWPANPLTTGWTVKSQLLGDRKTLVDTVVLGGVMSIAGNGAQPGGLVPADTPSTTAETTACVVNARVGGVVQPQKPIIPLRVRLALTARLPLESSPSAPG